MPFASPIAYRMPMPKLAQLLQSIGLFALGCAATFFAVRGAWQISPWIILGPAICVALIMMYVTYSNSAKEAGRLVRDTGQLLVARYRAWRSLDVGIRYLVLGITVAVLALGNVYIHISEQRTKREQDEAYRASVKAADERRAAEEKAARDAADAAAKKQALTIRAFKPWTDFDALPIEQRTPERAREAEKSANEIARSNPATDTDDMRRRNSDECTKRIKAFEYRSMPVTERVALAAKLLGNGETSDAICKARAELANVRVKDRNDPAIKKLAGVIRAKELAILKADWDDAARSRGILCRDGTSSPSCMCEGSHRGCCSHHGGVAGCEPMPATERELTCPK